MFKKILISAVIASTFFFPLSYAKEPKNLDLVKGSLIKYHDSGEYPKEIAKVLDRAMQYLKTRITSEKRSGSHKKLAVVLDIDETSLSNYPNMLKMSFGGTNQQIDDMEKEGNDPVIAPTLELFRYAKANHVAVFFVTGRREDARDGTARNLSQVGYKDWDGLVLKPQDYHEKSAAPYKIQARTEIEKQGFDIVLSVGDQLSDLSGGHADKTFKVPNPYYLVP